MCVAGSPSTVASRADRCGGNGRVGSIDGRRSVAALLPARARRIRSARASVPSCPRYLRSPTPQATRGGASARKERNPCPLPPSAVLIDKLNPFCPGRANQRNTGEPPPPQRASLPRDAGGPAARWAGGLGRGPGGPRHILHGQAVYRPELNKRWGAGKRAVALSYCTRQSNRPGPLGR